MNWLKKEDSKVLGYDVALSVVPAGITSVMGSLSLAIVSETNAYWVIVSNIAAYLLMFFGILSLASSNEKTRSHLLAAGLGMTMLGIFSAHNSAGLLFKIDKFDNVDKEYTIIFSSLLQNVCLYLSAAVGGGIVASSIFAKEKSEQKTDQATETKVEPVKDAPQEKAAQQPVAQAAAEEKEVEQES
ncbi:hypothetical protein [Chromobacterium piscinae]|uniref:hypothetical protein n=1 Tax=Chromobacterium piscinae TaxID=686831 RepID=UPI00320B7228